MDLRVKEVQEWLGSKYPSYFHYDENGTGSGSFPVKPDGMTGNTTVKALIMALQIHLNLKPVDGIWGNGTSAASYNKQYNKKYRFDKNHARRIYLQRI